MGEMESNPVEASAHSVNFRPTKDRSRSTGKVGEVKEGRVGSVTLFMQMQTHGSSTGIRVRNATSDDIQQIYRCLAAAFAPFRAEYTEAAFADTVPLESHL